MNMLLFFNKMIACKDRETRHFLRQHHDGVMMYAGNLAVVINPLMVDVIVTAAMLHDLGKIGIPDHVLFKPNKLNNYEWELMRLHPVVGAQLIAKGNDDLNLGREELNIIVEAVKHHHERWDGGGYPDGLKGEEIPLAARILALADAYDAMVSMRPYRKPLGRDEALAEIARNAGTQFDPELAKIFVKVNYPFLTPPG